MTHEREPVVVTPRKAVHPSTAEAFHRLQRETEIAKLIEKISWYDRRIMECRGRAARVSLEDQRERLTRQLRDLQEVQDVSGTD